MIDVPVPYVVYDDRGRITGRGASGQFMLDILRKSGSKILVTDREYDFSIDDAKVPIYVDLSGTEPVLRGRPAWTPEIDTLEPMTRQELTIANAPSCCVNFTGPQAGRQDHPQPGPLKIGWTTPGTYELLIDAFPAMPIRLEVKVRPRLAISVTARA